MKLRIILIIFCVPFYSLYAQQLDQFNLDKSTTGQFTTITSETDFLEQYEQDCGSLDDLILEDFSGGPNQAMDCFATISNDNPYNGICFDEGEIEVGIEITGGVAVFFRPAGSLGNHTNDLVHGVGTTVISFPVFDVYAAGWYYYNLSDVSTVFRFYDENENLLFTSTQVRVSDSEHFLGFISNEPISRVEFEGENNSLAAFGRISFSDCNTLSVSDFVEKNIAVYPNPVINELNIELTSGIKFQRAIIYDINGRFVSEFDLVENRNNHRLDLDNLKVGNYFLILEGNNNRIIKQIIKKG